MREKKDPRHLFFARTDSEGETQLVSAGFSMVLLSDGKGEKQRGPERQAGTADRPCENCGDDAFLKCLELKATGTCS